MKISFIELVFENCEVLHIDSRDVIHLQILGEKKSFNRYATSLVQNISIESLCLVLNKDIKSQDPSWTVAKRLSYQDVTHIALYDNEEKCIESYIVEWGDDCNMYSTSYQSLKFTPQGHIIFVSSPVPMPVDTKDIDDSAMWLFDKGE